jgi:hypothetical protein
MTLRPSGSEPPERRRGGYSPMRRFDPAINPFRSTFTAANPDTGHKSYFSS